MRDRSTTQREKDRLGSAARSANFKAQGLCPTCGSKPKPGRICCAECIAKNTKTSKARYEQKRATRSCERCGTKLAATGKVHCEVCIPIVRDQRKARLDTKRQTKHCIYCPAKAREGYRTCEACAFKVSQNCKERNAKIRLEVLTHYSGGPPKCAECGYNANLKALHIDHINGGGCKHYRQIRSSLGPWLKTRGFPVGYQILCANCNSIKGGVNPLTLEYRAKQKNVNPPKDNENGLPDQSG